VGLLRHPASKRIKQQCQVKTEIRVGRFEPSLETRRCPMLMSRKS